MLCSILRRKSRNYALFNSVFNLPITNYFVWCNNLVAYDLHHKTHENVTEFRLLILATGACVEGYTSNAAIQHMRV